MSFKPLHRMASAGMIALAIAGCTAASPPVQTASGTADFPALCTPEAMTALAAGLGQGVTVKQVPNGPQLPGGTQLVPASGKVPAYCQVTGSYVTNPQTGKTANFIATFPESWNGKYLQLGCSGQCGFLLMNNPASPPITVTAQGYPKQLIEKGYATFGNDLGHVAASATAGGEGFMFNPDGSINSDVIEDYLVRADRVMADMGKAFTRAVYSRQTGRPSSIAKSYFSGCSQGGREAMMAATRFPEKFDGIIAGSPASDFPGVIWHSLARLVHAQKTAPAPLSAGQARMLQSLVVERCDAVDGVKDGLIQNPAACNIDPARDFPVCRAGEQGDSCISSAQAQNLSLTYSRATDDSGRLVQPAMPISDQSFAFTAQIPVGADLEAGLRGLVGPKFAGKPLFTVVPDEGRGPDGLRVAVNRDAYDAYLGVMRKGAVMAEDFGPFMKGRTKLLWYHNLSDEALTPYTSFNKYDQLVRLHGGNAAVERRIRFFAIPGSGHCGMGGVGPSNFDAIGALEQWVEGGKAPDTIVARLLDPKSENIIFGTVDWSKPSPRTMPLCVYPRMATYKGSGSVSEAANWECRADDRRMQEGGSTGRIGGVSR